MDLETGEVLWVGKGKRIVDFRKFFDEIDPVLLSQVKAVAMDINAVFNKVFSEKLPNVTIVYDRYHMEANYSREVMGAVRLDTARQFKKLAQDPTLTKEEKEDYTKRYTLLKGARWMLITKGLGTQDVNGKWNSSNDKLEDILNRHQDIALCYAMKEEMSSIYAETDVAKARERWERWFDTADVSNIGPLVKFSKNKRERLEGLIAHAKYAISTARVEGTNNKIKVLKRMAYGYRDDDYFFSLIRYMTIPGNSLLP